MSNCKILEIIDGTKLYTATDSKQGISRTVAEQQIKTLILELVDKAAKSHTMNKDFTTDYQNAFLNGIEAMQISVGRAIKDL